MASSGPQGTSSGPLGTSSGNQGSSVLPPLDQMRSACVMSFHLIPCFLLLLLCFLHLLCTFFIYRHISKISMHICRSTKCPTFHQKNFSENLTFSPPPDGQKFQIFKKINVLTCGIFIWFMKFFSKFPDMYPDVI